ncbi:dihydroxy-acid dehydratase-like [Convolutriloba macropyga]|uniref:dihydroxy-acid dehydratase-like n=1 Tax=Convolutriloba macropyga TaxID=536237 RepID=UPI003F527F9C
MTSSDDIEDFPTNSCRQYSTKLTDDPKQSMSQSFFYGIGLSESDQKKPFVGISSCWIEGNPCNNHLDRLALWVKEGVQNNGMNGLRFNAISISDAISMGTDGMRYSLLSREIICDSVETVTECLHYDANVSIPNCDKNMPGVIMAQIRINRPSIVVYGGSMYVKEYKGKMHDIGQASELYGKMISGVITNEERIEITKHSSDCSGSCPGLYTANTMAIAIEAMGMSLPNSSSTPALHEDKQKECYKIGPAMKRLLVRNIKPLDIITRKSLENAITAVCAIGGSTNAVLHILAIAHTGNIQLEIKDFQPISDRVPYIGNLKPSGKYFMQDLHEVGGTCIFLKHLLDNGFLHGDCLTVTGKTLIENLAHVPSLESLRQDVIFSCKMPKKTTSNLKLLHGNLAPEGSVAKISGKEGHFFKGPAIVFDSEQEMLESFKHNKVQKGMVVVIRYEGPKNGMPEMLYPTGALVGANLSQHCALVTDGRFSGASHGFIIGHVSPEAFSGGPIALVQSGDVITIDVNTLLLHVDLSEEEMEARRANWVMPPLKCKHGSLRKFARVVQSASKGCITDYSCYEVTD